MPGGAGRLTSGTTMGEVASADGTTIVFDRYGAGPAVVLVHGAFTGRAHPTLSAVAAALAPWFTVFNYDRRGRGDSGNTLPYAVSREIEDLMAVVGIAGGSALVFGGSSGAGLALAAASGNPAVTRLALWEPPYHVDASAPPVPPDFAARLESLVTDGRRGDAVERFLVDAAGMPAGAVEAMRRDPSWPETEAVAHTLAYEAAVMGPGNALPAGRLAAVTAPTLVLTGGASPAWLVNAGLAVTAAIPGAVHRVLDGQTHGVAAEALTPELLEFFAA
ncbi:MAG TPA: alpha/beta hydrolase [Streptosporangiaceae bacterium]